MMRKLVTLFVMIVVVCLVGTALFMLGHADLYGTYAWGEWLQVLGHSVPQHLTVAGYVLALPLVLELVRQWLPQHQRWYGRFMGIYLPVMAVLLVLGWAANVGLYGYWGIVLDSTVLIYLFDDPLAALAEVPLWANLTVAVLCGLAGWGAYRSAKLAFGETRERSTMNSDRRRVAGVAGRVGKTLLGLLLCGLDFLAIRGGWTTSTMNPGRAYFSSEMSLNHAAVDPVFNFLYSLGRQKDFAKQYRFMTDEEAASALEELREATTPQLAGDSLARREQLLGQKRPNVLLIIFESFSGSACHYLTPEADPAWMPYYNRCMEEGVAFTRFYANSFRTDRGVAAILASYPGQPTYSVMKNQAKCNNLAYLSAQMREAGYDLQFVHGGDVNFTNMQGFLRAGGFDRIVGDTDFPMSERLDKWGVRDDRMFGYLREQMSKPHEQPWLKVFLTLSSHEPFEVPYHHFEDIYLNSVAYTDSCLGAFIADVKADTALWNNLLIVGLPDHCFARYPASIQQHEPLRYRAPMFWLGGALTETTDAAGQTTRHREVTTLGQQTDLAATLLGQLDVPCEGLVFSKDMLDPAQPHYAFYSFSDGFGLITDSCSYVQDNSNSGHGLQPGTNDEAGRAQRWGKAYLQRLYDDLSRR